MFLTIVGEDVFHLVCNFFFILVNVNVLTMGCEDVFHLVSMKFFFHLVREDVLTLVSVNVSHHGV